MHKSLISCAVLLVSTCALAGEPRLPAQYLPVPLVRQAESYSCGAAALLGVLQYWKSYDGGEASLYPLLETTPKDGTEPDKMTAFAVSLGLTATMKENSTVDDLRAGLARGDTMILDIQAWADKPPVSWRDTWDDGHYVVLIGLDSEYAYVMDPSAVAGYAYLPIAELVDRWHDYEDRHPPTIRRYVGLAITVHGKVPLTSLPGPLIRME